VMVKYLVYFPLRYSMKHEIYDNKTTDREIMPFGSD